MICDNEVVQYVPKGWDYKAVTLKCGNTSIHGTPLYCDECEAKFAKRGYAAHECRHGTDMSREGSFCSACEFDYE
jgi:hypothetical protein